MSQSVFISYAREDDEPFAKRLYEDLAKAGFEVWWDRVSMPSRRLTFYQEIADAIRSHDRLILIVGPRAAISASVHQEWQWALGLDKPVIPILRKGDYTHLPGELNSVQCDDFRDDGQYPDQLAKLIENLRRPEPPLGALFAVPSLPPHFLGRPNLLRQVKDALLADLKAPVVITASDARVGMHGMGGIGKSVLAAAIARDREVRRCYPDGIIWLTIGQQSDAVTLQRNAARHLGYREHFDPDADVQSVLKPLLEKKAVLLILDDVWKTSDAQAFDVLGPRCRALVTTRDAGILHTLGGPSVPVSLLTEEEALQLLADAVGVEASALPREAREVVKECGCLALGVALCGSMVKKHGGDWTAILNRLRNADIERIIDPNAIEERHRSIWRAMQVSVDVLSPNEQRRFVELAVFVTDNPVPEATVATFWAHTGNLSDLDTADLLINLAERSLIRLRQEPAVPGERVERRISLHDFLYDFAAKRAGPPKPLHRALLDAYRKKCTNGWHTGPNDGYFYQHLAYHLHAGGKQEELKKVLFDYRWLRSKLNATDPNALMADYDLIDDDPQARLVQGAIRLSSHTIAVNHFHLPSQLFGRLLSQKGSRIKGLLDSVRTIEYAPWLRPLTPTLVQSGGALVRTIESQRTNEVMVVSPDGRRIIAGSVDHTLKVWDAEDGILLRTLEGHRNSITALNITPDGRHVISGSEDGAFKVWNIEDGSVSSDGSVKEWNIDDGVEMNRFTKKEHSITAIVVTPDGRHAVLATNSATLILWDLENGTELHRFSAITYGQVDIQAMSITPDGRFIVTGSDYGNVHTQDVADGQNLTWIGYHGNSICALAVTPDGRYVVSGSFDGRIKVWDLKNKKELRTLMGHKGMVKSIAILPNGRRMVSAAWDYTLKLWDLHTGHEERTFIGHFDWVNAVGVMPDGRHIVSASKDNTLKIWDIEANAESYHHTGHHAEVRAVAVTPDGRRAVSVCDDGILKVWDMINCREVRTCKVGTADVLAITPDGRYAIPAKYDFKVFNLDTGEEVYDLRVKYKSGFANPDALPQIIGLAATGDGRHLISASDDGTVRIWDIKAGVELFRFRGHDACDSWGGGRGGSRCPLRAVSVTPDGTRAVSASQDARLDVWDLENRRLLQTLPGHSGGGGRGWVYAVAITPDGKRAASASADGTEKLWDLVSGAVIRVVDGPTAYAKGVAITPDCKLAVSARGLTLALWSLDTGETISSYCSESRINCCAITPDGVKIIAGDQFGQLHFLRLENVK